MSNGKKWVLLTIGVMAVLIVGFGVLAVHINKGNVYEPQQNIFFLEYENEYEKEDTIIFKYDQIKDEVVELGKVKGYFHDCVINEEESVITGIFSKNMTGTGYDVVRYDIAAGTTEYLNIEEIVNELTTGNAKEFIVALVYDEGNKVLITYDDENEDKWWLFYDLITGEYDKILQEESRISDFITIHNNNLWYQSGWSLYQYDLETQKKTKILDSFNSAAVAPDTGLVAYTRDIGHKKIYLYDINTQRTKCIAGGGWNICYGDLSYTDAGWSNDGRQFFYIKSFPGLFNESTKRLMIYDVKTGNSHCIYKEDLTLHMFRYVRR